MRRLRPSSFSAVDDSSNAIVSGLVVLGIAYLAVTGYAMVSLPYDLWGGLVAAPLIVLVSVPLLGRLFRGGDRDVLRIAFVGLLAKLAGAMAFHWISFTAYAGEADPGRYHAVGRELSGAVRSGEASLWSVIPRSQGTPFLEELTGLVYTVFGSSRLAGFMLFAWMSFWGAAFFVRAGFIGVPGIWRRGYAALVFLLPSIVLWSSTIGKEAPTMLFLGVASYGVARLCRGMWSGWSLLSIAFGMVGAGFLRPHFASLWLGSLVLALGTGVVVGSVGRGSGARVRGLLLIGAGLAALVLVAQVTLRYLDPSQEGDNVAVSDRVSDIFERTETSTTIGGSSFVPMDVTGPQDWPVAIIRTLTRPMLNEAYNLETLLPGLEITVLLLLAAVGWRRVANLPRMLSHPYVVFAVVILVAFGLAWARFGNLGLLVRQRSLVTPLLVLMICLPKRSPKRAGVSPGAERAMASASA